MSASLKIATQANKEATAKMSAGEKITAEGFTKLLNLNHVVLTDALIAGDTMVGEAAAAVLVGLKYSLRIAGFLESFDTVTQTYSVTGGL